jgi:hypothetical protein
MELPMEIKVSETADAESSSLSGAIMCTDSPSLEEGSQLERQQPSTSSVGEDRPLIVAPPQQQQTRRIPVDPPGSRTDQRQRSQEEVQRPPSSSVTTATTDELPVKQELCERRRPGAYSVMKIQPEGTVVCKVEVPPGTLPGSYFRVYIMDRTVEVMCPADSVPQELDIVVPVARIYRYKPLKPAQLTASPAVATAANGQSLGGAFPMMPGIRRLNEQASRLGGTAQTQVVTVPDGVAPGELFSVLVGGDRLRMECPPNTMPGQRIRIVIPPVERTDEATPGVTQQTFYAEVPDGAQPGDRFVYAISEAQQVLVQCPPTVVPGQRIPIQMPTRADGDRAQLSYASQHGSGWRRTVRASDLNFEWVRVQDDSVLEVSSGADSTFDFVHSAFVRKLTMLEGNDPRLPTASIELVPAMQAATINTKLKTEDGKTLAMYADIALYQGKPLGEKHSWFLDVCKHLTSAVSRDHIGTRLSVKLLIRREHLFADSMRAVLSLSSQDMRRQWEIEFLGEPGVDRGGLTKEWFQCVTEQLFDPAFGLFEGSSSNQAAVDVNPASGTFCGCARGLVGVGEFYLNEIGSCYDVGYLHLNSPYIFIRGIVSGRPFTLLPL